jgi:peroxiredoxin
MPLKVGDRVPAGKFRVMTAEGPAWKTTDDVFKGKKVALFAVPGAFTSTCHRQHMPTIVNNVDALKAKGVDTVAVTAVNDVSVLAEWKKATGADKVDMLGDGNADFAKAIDLSLDLTGGGMGIRSKRYSMLVDDGVVKALNIEEPGKFEVSGGDVLLKQI